MAEILTIGAFGWTEQEFFAALEAAGVDRFVDVRRRRGVRGSEYAFVNSARLQARLAELGIAYEHRLDLAPSDLVRAVQARADAAGGVAKRHRSDLSEEFVRAYADDVLPRFDAAGFLANVRAEGSRTCLFCVERLPTACHRSLLAGRLEAEGASLEHLLP